ncbi:hypothetical protein FO519_004747 [Halicephalobus sp. NKZ332]|nr:hypothetical protein FO519_004747 [Halicephalobus sp. NKZ332]
MSETPSWSPYVVLGGTALGAIMEFFAFIAFSYLLIKYVIRKSGPVTSIEISSSMVLYMVLEVLCGICISLYLGYISIFWHYNFTRYNGYVLFILGSFQVIMITCKPVTVFFLGVDRIFCVLFPFTYVERKRRIPIFGAAVFIVIIILIALVTRIIPNWPDSDETTCSSFGCMTSPESGEIYNIERFICSGGNMTLGILLAILVSKKLKNESITKIRSSKLTIITLCLTFILDLLPHIIGTASIQVLRFNPTIYIGPYSSIVGAMESFFCAIIYSWTFHKVKKSQKIKNSFGSKSTKGNTFMVTVEKRQQRSVVKNLNPVN